MPPVREPPLDLNVEVGADMTEGGWALVECTTDGVEEVLTGGDEVPEVTRGVVVRTESGRVDLVP